MSYNNYDFISFIGQYYGVNKIKDYTKLQRFDEYDYKIEPNFEDPITIEVKERHTEYDDILIEMIQHIPQVKACNTATSYEQLHVSIGWWYKTHCDVLLYAMGQYVYIIDFHKFKIFVEKNAKEENWTLITSYKTTKSINAKIPINKIPQDIIKKVSKTSYNVEKSITVEYV